MSTLNAVFELYAHTLRKLLNINPDLYFDVMKLKNKEISDADIKTIKLFIYRFELSTWEKDKCYRNLYDVATPQDRILSVLQEHIDAMEKVELVRSTTPEFKF